MSRMDRLTDIVLAVLATVFLLVPAILTALLILVCDGGPIFYRSKRMKSPDQSFDLWKFRTMVQDSADNSVSGGIKQDVLHDWDQFYAPAGLMK